MNMAKAAAANSECLSRGLGAVIVRDDKFQVSTGYNGPPPGFASPKNDALWFAGLTIEANRNKFDCHRDFRLLPDSKKQTEIARCQECPRRMLGISSGEHMNVCPCAHAERNAIAIAAKYGHSTYGCKLYLATMTDKQSAIYHTSICVDCAYSIVAAGIEEVITKRLTPFESEGFNSEIIFRECGVSVREPYVE